METKRKKTRALYLIPYTLCFPRIERARGMTLIETLVAITILSLSIIGPMALTMQSLSSAYYARDQVIAANLAQEAIESVRAVRDGNILSIALSSSATCGGSPMHLLCGFPTIGPSGVDFMIDTRTNTMTACSGVCPKLKTDSAQTFYGYPGGGETGWTDTVYRRTVHAEFVSPGTDEVRLTVTVARDDGVHQLPPTVISENLYRWVDDGSGE